MTLGHIHDRLVSAAESTLADIADDSDDLARGFLELGAESFADIHGFADGIAIGPIFPRERLIDDQYPLGLSGIAFVEGTAAQERDVQGREIMRGHETPLFIAVEGVALVERPAIDDEGKVDAAFDGQADSGGGGLHSGKRLDALDHLAHHVLGLGRGIVLAAGQRGLHGDDIMRIEAGLRGSQSKESADHERRASEQDDSQRHFTDNK